MPVLGALMGLLLLSGAAAAINPGAEAPALPSYIVTLTGYNAVPSQTKSDPSTTANGGSANPDVVAARSRDLADELPFGTIIAISHASTTPADSSCGYSAVESLIGYRVITDTMNERIKDHVDVLFATNATVKSSGKLVNASRATGSCGDTTITVVGHIDLTHVGNLPTTQAELATIVEKPGIALK